MLHGIVMEVHMCTMHIVLWGRGERYSALA